VEILSNEKPSDTQRCRRTQTFSLIGGLTLGLRIRFVQVGEAGTCVKTSVYRKRQREEGMDSRGTVAGNIFIEGHKETQEWVGIFAWGLLSWPWSHFMA
jgi:hypothetical protein